MCRFPTKVVEDKIYRDPTEEEYLVDIVLEESAIVVFGASAGELSAGGIREEASYAPGNWHVNLYHGIPSDQDNYSVQRVESQLLSPVTGNRWRKQSKQ
jgi:hypothetical protein